MQHGPDTQYCTISFNTDEDMNSAFFELIHNSSEGFSGIGEKEINITQEQCIMLNSKNIKYQHVEENLSATT